MAVPRQVVTNDDLAQQIETSDEWIQTRTGIVERRIAAPDEHTSVLATDAARGALARAGVAAANVDLVILATCTPDRLFPATACTVQANLGIPAAGAFDLVAACSGFLYGLSVATNMIRSGAHRTVLLMGVDLFSHILNWEDRTTCVLFGDAAGAVVLQATDQPVGMLTCVLGAMGEVEDVMMIEAGGTRMPLTPELLGHPAQFFAMNGREVYKYAVRVMAESSQQAVAEAGLTMDDIRLAIPHQANLRIVEGLAKRLPLPMERMYVNLDRYGNTSAASIPLALAEAADAGQMQAGDDVLLTAAGGGLTWGAAVVRWNADAVGRKA
jgi:3-oxoacyl-[acyl-carrier-protein] synthase-3